MRVMNGQSRKRSSRTTLDGKKEKVVKRIVQTKWCVNDGTMMYWKCEKKWPFAAVSRLSTSCRRAEHQKGVRAPSRFGLMRGTGLISVWVTPDLLTNELSVGLGRGPSSPYAV